MSSYGTPNGGITSNDDPIQARNLAAEEARQEITRTIAAKVMAERGFDPTESAQYGTMPVRLRGLREAVEKQIAAECEIAFKAAGLL